jgi:hypothetical protein
MTGETTLDSTYTQHYLMILFIVPLHEGTPHTHFFLSEWSVVS